MLSQATLALILLSTLAGAADLDPRTCVARYRRFGGVPTIQIEGTHLQTHVDPATGMRLTVFDSSGLASLTNALIREHSFYSLIEHRGHHLGANPLANFEKGAVVRYFAEADAQKLAAVPAPKRAFNHSKDFDTANETGDPESGKFFRMLIKDQLRQHRADPRWQQVNKPPFDVFELPTDDPLMKEFLDSLLGKYVSGINVMTNESGTEKFSIFSGQIRRVFSMKSPENSYGLNPEVIFAEIQAADGKISTVLLSPQQGMASHDLFLHDYKIPARVMERRQEVSAARRSAGQAERSALRESPLYQGTQDVGRGRLAPEDPSALGDLLATGAATIQRFENPRTMVSGMTRAGLHRVTFYMPRKREYLLLQKGDLLWDLRTARYFIVGVDRIPNDLIHNYRPTIKESRLVIVRTSDSRPAVPSTPAIALPAPGPAPGSAPR